MPKGSLNDLQRGVAVLSQLIMRWQNDGEKANAPKLSEGVCIKKLSEIPNAVTNLKLGVVLGLTHHDDGWYDETNTLASPFNQRIASLTIGELDDKKIANIVHDLTMGELADSGFFEVHYGDKIDEDLLYRAKYDDTFEYQAGDWRNMTITQLLDATYGWEYTPGA